ncbi:hypothetical protein [Piscirickettsia litoralis]|uniref:hypothetical protein n=1 Tax=Piscirickettsia litoralis TaxID=1891921 RepID=UPI00293937C6|nr:hypothetical protein [Piscirickettsia litoralis]
MAGGGSVEASAEEVPAEPEEKKEESSEPALGGDDITDEEFDQLLNELHGSNVPGAGPSETEDKKGGEAGS